MATLHAIFGIGSLVIGPKAGELDLQELEKHKKLMELSFTDLVVINRGNSNAQQYYASLD